MQKSNFAVAQIPASQQHCHFKPIDWNKCSLNWATRYPNKRFYFVCCLSLHYINCYRNVLVKVIQRVCDSIEEQKTENSRWDCHWPPSQHHLIREHQPKQNLVLLLKITHTHRGSFHATLLTLYIDKMSQDVSTLCVVVSGRKPMTGKP